MAIPEDWLHCPRKGGIIAGKFLPFKTPLHDDQVSDECRFDVDMLFLSIGSSKIKLGLWIDLTNTERYYKRTTVKDCEYWKMKCEGQKLPSDAQKKGFIDKCDNFFIKSDRNPQDKIGVHCTHGFNRTGYLIVSYLVEKMNWSVEGALKTFSEARPPGIYKQDYLDKLYSLYGRGKRAPRAPQQPNWYAIAQELLQQQKPPKPQQQKQSADSDNFTTVSYKHSKRDQVVSTNASEQDECRTEQEECNSEQDVCRAEEEECRAEQEECCAEQEECCAEQDECCSNQKVCHSEQKVCHSEQKVCHSEQKGLRPRRDLFISPVPKNYTEHDIRDMITKHRVEILDIVEMSRKRDDKMSYMITIWADHENVLMQPNVWSRPIKCYRF